MRRLLAALLPAAALGLLTACDGGTGEQQAQVDIPALKNTANFSAANAYAHCASICALGPRHSGSDAYAAQLDYLEQQLRAAGWQVERHPFSPKPGIRMVNLRASYGDAPEATRPLLVSCHIDTKVGIANFIGADDGASGAAVMLEAARILATRHPERAAQIELIFFDGEEAFGRRMSWQDGMYGSQYDVARRREADLGLPQWQVNLDMVGGRDMMIAPPLIDCSEQMFEQYVKAAETLRLSPQRWSSYPGTYLDDHLPYVEAGVDSLNLIAHFQGSDWWHTPADNMERISQRSLEESGRMLLQLTEQLLGDKP